MGRSPRDCEAPCHVAQVKCVKRLSLTELEQLAMEIAEMGRKRNKSGVVVLNHRAGRGRETPQLICMTEETWGILQAETVGGIKLDSVTDQCAARRTE